MQDRDMWNVSIGRGQITAGDLIGLANVSYDDESVLCIARALRDFTIPETLALFLTEPTRDGAGSEDEEFCAFLEQRGFVEILPFKQCAFAAHGKVDRVLACPKHEFTAEPERHAAPELPAVFHEMEKLLFPNRKPNRTCKHCGVHEGHE